MADDPVSLLEVFFSISSGVSELLADALIQMRKLTLESACINSQECELPGLYHCL